MARFGGSRQAPMKRHMFGCRIPETMLISAMNSSSTALGTVSACADPVSTLTATGVPFHLALQTWPNPPPPMTSSNFSSEKVIFEESDDDASEDMVRSFLMCCILFLGSSAGSTAADASLSFSSFSLCCLCFSMLSVLSCSSSCFVLHLGPDTPDSILTSCSSSRARDRGASRWKLLASPVLRFGTSGRPGNASARSQDAESAFARSHDAESVSVRGTPELSPNAAELSDPSSALVKESGMLLIWLPFSFKTRAKSRFPLV
mmetsp:Transcript_18955/g.40628  ORF Transcript_18955/g.40628 Transcript_18955/m.40628 type:complete len:261 (-) Transcript_18955:79-861(-)